MIFGRPGSGKSTLAYNLHKQTNLPLFHLDKYFYKTSWIERNYDEFLAFQKGIVNKPSWIIDGNCLRSLEMRFSKADLILYLNGSKGHCLFRIIKRRLHKCPNIDDRAENCAEKINWKLIKGMWTFEKRITDLLQNLKAKYPDQKIIEIQSTSHLSQLDE